MIGPLARPIIKVSLSPGERQTCVDAEEWLEFIILVKIESARGHFVKNVIPKVL